MTGSGGYPVRREPVARMSGATCGTTADPHVAPLMRATITKHNFVFSRQDAPEFCKFIRPKIRGRREDRVRAAPAVSRAKMHIAKRTRAYRFSGSSPAFPAQWFYAYFVLSPARPGLLVTVVARIPPRNLTPATGASGPHDFTVRITRRSSKAHPRPPLPAPTSVTMANSPLSGRDSKD